MNVNLCGQCYLSGFCRRLKSRAVTDAELTAAFVRDLRAHMRLLDLTRDQWASFLIEAYRDYPGIITDALGDEIALDTSVVDRATIRYWFRDMCRALDADTSPRVRHESKERLKVTASILRALHPVPASLWGKTIANDERPEPCLPDYNHVRTTCPIRLDWDAPVSPLVWLRK